MLDTIVPAFTKTITYSRADHDYSAYLDNEYIGSFPTHLDAETALNQVAYDLLRHTAIETTDAEAERAADESTEAPLLVEPSTPRGTPNQERAAAQLQRIVRRKGTDGGTYIHGYRICSRCGRETFHRAFDNASFPICQDPAHGPDEDEDWDTKPTDRTIRRPVEGCAALLAEADVVIEQPESYFRDPTPLDIERTIATHLVFQARAQLLHSWAQDVGHPTNAFFILPDGETAERVCLVVNGEPVHLPAALVAAGLGIGR